MDNLESIFTQGAKVVISPDQMRAWVRLPKPPRGIAYTAEAIAAWLPQNGVVFGADTAMMQRAAASRDYDELLEVARGRQPEAGAGAGYAMRMDVRPFTGLSAASDGALMYDNLSFLQEAPAGAVLAEVLPAREGVPGMTVTGDELPPPQPAAGRELAGGGFELSADGRYYVAPGLSHVSMVNGQLAVTPLLRLPRLSAGDGPVDFPGNVLVQGDVTAGASVTAGGSIFVEGRSVSARFTAGNNLLLCGGMRNEGGQSLAKAGGSVWGLFFETCEIQAGGDVCANHLMGCEVCADGRALIIGGRGLISRTNLYAKGGVVCSKLGDGPGDSCAVAAGVRREVPDTYAELERKIARLAQDMQGIQQNLIAHERVNRMRADRGRGDSFHKDLALRREQATSVMNALEAERTRIKRQLESTAVVAVVVRDRVFPGIEITIDARSLKIISPMQRTRFTRSGEVLQATAAGK